MTNNYKKIDEKYLSAGEDLKNRTRDSINGTHRVWVVVHYDVNGHEYCVGCDVLNSVFANGWREETWFFDSGYVHLYTRLPV